MGGDVVIPHLGYVTVAPITTTVRGIPTELMLGPECGLKVPSAAKFDLLQSVPKERVGRFLGTVDPGRRQEMIDAALFALGLEQPQ